MKLQPWGTVIGRVVDEEGKPRTDVEIFSTIRERPDPERGDLDDKPTGGRPGPLPHRGPRPGRQVRCGRPLPRGRAGGPILKGVQVGPGEVKDLGDITLPTVRKGGN